MPGLSVSVITSNEASNIAAALESVRWADEIIVVDAESTDDTVAIARRFTDRVVVRPWPGYVDQKNFAASLATHDWILSLDADERVTPELAEEIRTLLEIRPDPAGSLRATGATKPPHAAYRVPRVTWHLGRWIRTTDWYPDLQIRLYDRRRARWTGAYVHEGLTVDGTLGELRNELEHRPYRDLAEHLETIDRYTTAAARQMFEAGRRASLLQPIAHTPIAFLRNYLLRGGIRDGRVGFTISALNAYYVFVKFLKLRELSRAARAADSTSETRPAA